MGTKGFRKGMDNQTDKLKKQHNHLNNWVFILYVKPN